LHHGLLKNGKFSFSGHSLFVKPGIVFFFPKIPSGYPLSIMGKNKKQNARSLFMLNKAHMPLHCQKWAMLDSHLAQALISAMTSPLFLTLHYLEGTLHL
jgi:hypothetical protein